jgi:hypothetical protein
MTKPINPRKGQRVSVRVVDFMGNFLGYGDAKFVGYLRGTHIAVVKQGNKLYEVNKIERKSSK